MSKHILIVEDDLPIRELYEHILQNAGYKVTAAANGKEGLAKAKENTDLDLILLDVMMPVLNGIDTLKALKADDTTKDIPVILLTNLGQEEIILEAFKLGAQSYLIKVQIKPHELIKEVENFLSQQSEKTEKK